MKVRELIAALSKVDQDLGVLCMSEDDRLVEEGHLFLLLDVLDVQVSEAERTRYDGEPYLTLGRGKNSERIAFINVTTYF